MRKTVLLLISMVAALVVASGVTLATTLRCDGGKCQGTPTADRMLGTSARDIIYKLKDDDRLLSTFGKDDLYGATVLLLALLDSDRK